MVILFGIGRPKTVRHFRDARLGGELDPDRKPRPGKPLARLGRGIRRGCNNACEFHPAALVAKANESSVRAQGHSTLTLDSESSGTQHFDVGGCVGEVSGC